MAMVYADFLVAGGGDTLEVGCGQTRVVSTRVSALTFWACQIECGWVELKVFVDTKVVSGPHVWI